MLRYAPVLLIAVACGSAWASESYQPPEGGAWQKARLYLKPAGPSPDASGVAVFACNTAETFHRVQVYARGVRSRGVHTLWLVDMEGSKVKRTHEMTSRWRKLRADRRGVAYFIGSLPWCPVGRTALVVKHHPNERRRGFDDGITVLKGYLRTME
jgi:hypothetical protein